MASVVGTIPKPVRKVGGVLKVGDTRVPLDSVVYEFKNGKDASEIRREYDSLSLAQVHAAIAYYLHNQIEVDRYLSQREIDRDAMWREHYAQHPRHITRETLMARTNGAGLNRKT